MRLVIDSNVWISALVYGGKPRQIFESVVADGLTIIVSEEILTEVRRILSQKFPDFVQDFEDLLTVLQPRVALIKLGSVTVDTCRDPDDNAVLETALIGGAELLVSGDKDLLSIGEFGQTVIVCPADALEKL